MELLLIYLLVTKKRFKMISAFIIAANSSDQLSYSPLLYCHHHILCIYVTVIAFSLPISIKTNRHGWIIRDNNSSQP